MALLDSLAAVGAADVHVLAVGLKVGAEVLQLAPPLAATPTHVTLHLKPQHTTPLLLVIHDREANTLAQGARPLIGDDSVYADSAEVLSTAAGEVGLSGDVETEGTLVVLRGNQEVALVASDIRGRHLQLLFTLTCSALLYK